MVSPFFACAFRMRKISPACASGWRPMAMARRPCRAVADVGFEFGKGAWVRMARHGRGGAEGTMARGRLGQDRGGAGARKSQGRAVRDTKRPAEVRPEVDDRNGTGGLLSGCAVSCDFDSAPTLVGDDPAALKSISGRDAADAELGRTVRVVVDVEFGDLEPGRRILGHVVEDGGDHLAGDRTIRPSNRHVLMLPSSSAMTLLNLPARTSSMICLRGWSEC